MVSCRKPCAVHVCCPGLNPIHINSAPQLFSRHRAVIIRTPPFFLGYWGVACPSVAPHRRSHWPRHQLAKFLGSLWGTKITLGVRVNLTSCSSYSRVLSSDPGSDWGSKHTVKKAYVTSYWGWIEVPHSNGVGVRDFGV